MAFRLRPARCLSACWGKGSFCGAELDGHSCALRSAREDVEDGKEGAACGSGGADRHAQRQADRQGGRGLGAAEAGPRR